MVDSGVSDKHITGMLSRADLNSRAIANSPVLAYSIYAKAKGANGAMSVREVVQLVGSSPTILFWRQAER